MNESGQVLVWGSVKAPGGTGAVLEGIWLSRAADLKLAVRSDSTGPGLAPDETYRGFDWVVLADDGEIAFLSQAGNDIQQRVGIWGGNPGAVNLLARRDDPVSGYPNLVYGNVEYPVTAGARISWGADAMGGSKGLPSTPVAWLGPAASALMVVGPDRQLPGVDNGTCIGDVRVESMNTAGHVEVSGIFCRPNSPSPNTQSYWAGPSNSLTLFYQPGTQARDMPAGVTYSSSVTYQDDEAQFGLYFSPIDGRGHVVFSSYVKGPGINDFNNVGIWAGTPDSVHLIARAGLPAPGMPEGVVFDKGLYEVNGNPTAQFWNVWHNSAGRIAFHGRVAGPGVSEANNDAIWVGTEDNLRVMVREGDPAPGTEIGTKFADAMFVDAFGMTMLNSSGQVAFISWLAGPDVTEKNNQGIWATDGYGNIHLIARTGTLFDVGNGELRQAVGFGLENSLTAKGDFLFDVGFSDGTTGIFVATIPEPSTLLILVTSFLLCQRCKKSVH